MNAAFARGFIKRANEYGVDHDSALDSLKSMFGITDTKHDLFDAADPGRSSTGGEMLQIGKHIASAGAVPGLLGGGLGAGIGFLNPRSKDKRLKGALKGGLIGGGIGFGVGSGNDAYHLGANTRETMIGEETKGLNSLLADKADNDKGFGFFKNPEELYNKEEGRLKDNISALRDSNWLEFYYPPRILGKLR
mgnify:CR=1 FL=1